MKEQSLKRDKLMEPEIRIAELHVKQSQKQFDHAMEHLQGAVEDKTREVSQSWEDIQYKLKTPKRVYGVLKRQSRVAVQRARTRAEPALKDLSLRAQELQRTVKTDRRVRLGLGAALVAASGFALNRWLNQRKSNRHFHDTMLLDLTRNPDQNLDDDMIIIEEAIIRIVPDDEMDLAI